MKYWTIDSVTKEITGSFEGDKWNIPRNALLIEPLQTKEGFAVVANADLSETEYIADYRGKTIYNQEKPTQSKQVEKLGDIEDDWTLKQPPTTYHTFSVELDDWELTAEAEAKQLADVLQISINVIDNESAAVTAKWSRFAEEYKEREAAALAYKAVNYTGEVSIYITSFATPAGMNNQAAADLILKQADDLRALQSQLAAERMRKYELKQPDLTLDEIAALRDEIVANIEALGASYE